MTNLSILNKEGEIVGELTLNAEIFNKPINVPVMHQAVRLYLASQRRGTHSVKTRGQVAGGGKKPWRQKGTGRARVGSSRNPVWRGGGVAFGPHPRSYAFSMPRKMRRLALLSSLSQKAQDGKVVVVDQLDFEAPKTKEMARVLQNLQADNALLVLEEGNDNARLSAGNLQKITAVGAAGINTYAVLRHDKLVLTKEALASLEEVLG